MANFVPKPNGLTANGSVTCSLFNGQVQSYLIKSGYTNSIFSGDPVCIAGPNDLAGAYTGYLINYSDATKDTDNVTPVLGIFQGCSYVQPTYANPVDFASPGRPFFPLNTKTESDVPAIGFVMVDPNVLYRVLCNSSTGVTQPFVGQCANFLYVLDDNNKVQGNTQLGTSLVSIDTPVYTAKSTFNVYIDSILPTYPNTMMPSAISPLGSSYNYVNVLLQDPQMCKRNAPRQ